MRILTVPLTSQATFHRSAVHLYSLIHSHNRVVARSGSERPGPESAEDTERAKCLCETSIIGTIGDSRVLQRGRPSLAHCLPCPCSQGLPPGQSPPGPQCIRAFGTRYHNTDCGEMKGQFANTHIRRPKGILPATSVRINGDGFYWGNVICKQSPILGTLPKAWRAAQRPCPPALPSFRPCPLSPMTLGPVQACTVCPLCWVLPDPARAELPSTCRSVSTSN